MAIIIEFIDLVIPISTIERCSSIGGFQGFLHEEAKWIGSMIWWDDHLCRADGAMSSSNLPAMLERWEKRGLQVYSGEGDTRTFCDMCIIDAWRGPLRPCPWLAFQKAIAWHSAFSPGNTLVGPPQWFCPRLIGTSRLDLLAIRVQDMEIARRFYEAIGLSFSPERHGKGPEHFASKSLGWVFENLSARRRPFDKRAGGGFSSRVRRSCRRSSKTPWRGGDFLRPPRALGDCEPW